MDNQTEQLSIRATDIGEFVRYKSCQRRFKLGFKNRELARQLPFSGKLFATLDPVLRAAGWKRETEWEHYLKRLNFIDLCDYELRPSKSKSVSWAVFQERVRDLKIGQNAFIRELNVSGKLGAFHVSASIDFALIVWNNRRPTLRLVECKASRKDQTYHRAQLATYKVLVEQILEQEDTAFNVGGVQLATQQLECVVARIDENTNRGQAIMDIESFDLSMIEADVRRILEPDGIFHRIVTTPLEELNYQIESKCDDCLFNIHCLPESGRQRKLELLGLDPSTVRALNNGGIQNLDHLAKIDPTGLQSQDITRANDLPASMQFLKLKAFARLSTLPVPPAECFPVQFLSYRIFSQLPEHDILGHRLVRVYISVDYDYSENRIASLSAHVTTSEGKIFTGWQEIDGKKVPVPVVREKLYKSAQAIDELKLDVDVSARSGESPFEERALEGVDIIQTKLTPWTGFYEWDTEAERKILETFFIELVEGIKQAAGTRNHAPIHFYFWSRTEITKLVEACSRVGSDLLGHLQELLGCRESLEQLIYSCVQDEVDNRYGLGWTGRGLLVVSSLSWFGQTYHWNRLVNGVPTWIDREFHQDLFDFKADLAFDNGEWQKDAEENVRHRFELRSQFNDTLPAGYLQAFWGILDSEEHSSRDHSKQAIANFQRATRPGLLNEYLRARVHALRWVEERIEFKSSALQKPPVFLRDLPQFKLKADHPASACVDFLRLDFHLKFTDWLASHLIAPSERVLRGRTLPVSNVVSKNGRLFCELNAGRYGISLEELQLRSSFEEGAFVRLSPCDEDPVVSQTLKQFGRGGITCIIDRLDWDLKKIELSVIPLANADRYRLSSRKIDVDSLIFEFATIDDSPSDFISTRVEKRLEGKLGRHVYNWFDRTNPKIPHAEPLGDLAMHPLRKMLRSFVPGDSGILLAPDQINAILIGLDTTVQLLQGPPGTGKTMTTAIAIFVRILARLKKGNVVFVSANTHSAIDTLLGRISGLLKPLQTHAAAQSLEVPSISLFKAESKQVQASEALPKSITEIGSGSDIGNGPGKEAGIDPGIDTGKTEIISISANDDGIHRIKLATRSSVVIVGATTNTLLKMTDLDKELRADMLVIDEASMMVFPHFLALATLVRESGYFMLAGDHRQLSPILSQDWEREDRPPTVLYQPYSSAYDAVRDLSAAVEDPQVTMSALQYTFRLPVEIRRLIARLYKLDDVELVGADKSSSKPRKLVDNAGSTPQTDPFKLIWEAETGLFLIIHNERESRQGNLLEVQIIEKIMEGAGNSFPAGSVAVVTPHRVQRMLLQKELNRFSEAVDLIDTVEKLQGGERPTVIFSATVSDPSAIASSVEFILDLNRSNVAFSRAKERLVIVCSEELINFIPASLTQYDETLLWKSLREVCSTKITDLSVNGFNIQVFKAI